MNQTGFAVASIVAVISIAAPAALQPDVNKECKTKLQVVPVTIEQSHLDRSNTLLTKEVTPTCMGGSIAWHFYNATEHEIDIDFLDFKVVKQGESPRPSEKAVKFKKGVFDSDQDGSVDPWESVTLVGIVSVANGNCVKYTIRLKGDGKTQLHDPRLEITDPPVMGAAWDKSRPDGPCSGT